MWTEHDRRLAQVLLQAKVVSPDDLHRTRERQREASQAEHDPPSLSEMLLGHGLVTPEQLRRFERSASVPTPAPAPAGETRSSGRRRGASRIPRTFGPFSILGPLASGASGTVYRARDSRTDAMVAVKVLTTGSSELNGIERFLREARVACALRHENLVSGYQIGKANGLHYLAMELVEGESAGARLRREKRLPEDEVVAIGRAICRALEYARHHGVVHRDVKPDNILIDTEGNVKLCDLGLARRFGHPTDVTESGIAVGTPRYIAPEQAKGDPRVDHRADLYALGITLFHLSTGKVPFDGDSGLDVITKHIYEKMPTLRSMRPELSVELDYIIRRATKKRARQRYETAGDMARDLDVLAARLHARARRAEEHPEPARAPRDPTDETQRLGWRRSSS